MVAEQNKGLQEYKAFLLKGLLMNSPTDKLTVSEFQCWGSSLKGFKGVQRGNERVQEYTERN